MKKRCYQMTLCDFLRALGPLNQLVPRDVTLSAQICECDSRDQIRTTHPVYRAYYTGTVRVRRQTSGLWSSHAWQGRLQTHSRVSDTHGHARHGRVAGRVQSFTDVLLYYSTQYWVVRHVHVNKRPRERIGIHVLPVARKPWPQR